MQGLWDFALRLYRAPGAAEACLSLQDGHGVQVTLLLYAAWAGAECGVALSADELALAGAGVRHWHAAVVQPLRGVRRHLKEAGPAAFHPGAAALRQSVKALELEAERLELEHLQGLLPARAAPQNPAPHIAMANLATMLASCAQRGEPWLQQLQGALQTLSPTSPHERDRQPDPDAPAAAQMPGPLGYGPMDDIHAEFEELLAVASAPGEPDWVSLLTRIDAHLRSHFEAEDGWMTETEFPPRECHIDEHAAVLKSSGEVLALAVRGETAVARSFVTELARWFPGHADHLDSALAAWMCHRRFGAGPVVLHPPRRAA